MSTTAAIILFVILFFVITGCVFTYYWDVIVSTLSRKRDGS